MKVRLLKDEYRLPPPAGVDNYFLVPLFRLDLCNVASLTSSQCVGVVNERGRREGEKQVLKDRNRKVSERVKEGGRKGKMRGDSKKKNRERSDTRDGWSERR